MLKSKPNGVMPFEVCGCASPGTPFDIAKVSMKDVLKHAAMSRSLRWPF